MDTSRPDQHSRVRAFFEQALEAATVYRLACAQKEMRNYQFLEREFDLLWSVAQRCYEQRDWERLMAFREALQPFLDLRGFWEHSLFLNQWAEKAARARGNALDEARLRHDRADMLNQLGRYREAEQLYLASETLYRQLGQDEQALKSRHMRSMVMRAQGRTREAQRLCQSVVTEARALQVGSWLAHPLYVLALFARDQGNSSQAAILIEESISLLSGSQEDTMVGQCYTFLGELALRQKDIARARKNLEMGLQLVQKTGNLRLIVNAQRLLGDVAMAEGHATEAATIYDELLSIFETKHLGDKLVLGKTLTSRAQLMKVTNRLQEAAQMLEAALALFDELGNVNRTVDASLLLIRIYLRQGRFLQAGKRFLSTAKVASSSSLIHPRTIIGWLRFCIPSLC